MSADSSDAVVFRALGGIGEIGMNVYLYEIGGRFLMVDLGLAFADDRLPGAELVLPDLRWIAERKDRLDGIVLTHAHEDHLGAVPYLWDEVGCPIWCTAFAAALLRRKLDESSLEERPRLEVVTPGEAFEVGRFSCRFAHVTHSIPDANALAIETPHGRIVHTGDWKLDETPLVGSVTDVPLLRRFGDEPVLALVADSTNALSAGRSGSEADVREALRNLIADQKQAVALTTFASNIARLETAMLAAAEAGREIIVVGRSMHRMIDAAREVGYLRDIPRLRDEREADSLPRNRVLYLVTGSQGEPRAALQRISTGQHQRVKLEAGDTAIFSSKIIPGNERALHNLHNALVARGVEVVTEEDHFVHVSGHPCRDEMIEMYRWMKPQIAVPVHGEARHLHAHERLAKAQGVPHVMLVRTGDELHLAPGTPHVAGSVAVGRRAIETTEFVDAGDELYRERRRIMNHGTVYVGLVLDCYGSLVAEPLLSSVGAVDPQSLSRVRADALEAISDAVEELEDDEIMDDSKVELAVRTAVRQGLALPRFKRPIVEVHLTRLPGEMVEATQSARNGADAR